MFYKLSSMQRLFFVETEHDHTSTFSFIYVIKNICKKYNLAGPGAAHSCIVSTKNDPWVWTKKNRIWSQLFS